MFSNEQLRHARRVLERCRVLGLTLATAESCTGGLISGCLTAIPGSSDIFTTGFVTYSNDAKTAQLGVDAEMIKREGAVSESVAVAMAQGAARAASAGASLGVTGIAGPGGGSAERPVGLVHMAFFRTGRPPLPARHVFAGDRHAIRMQTVEVALLALSRLLD